MKKYTLEDFQFGTSKEDVEIESLARSTFDKLKANPNCEYILQGRHRHAFRHKDYVYKVAWNADGVAANYEEVWISSRHPHEADQNQIVYAKCRLVNNACIVMEYLEDFRKKTTSKELPKWTMYVDMLQVGHSKSGVLKAYDYSII